MSTTVGGIQSLVNQYFHGDTSTNSVSASDRLAAITEAVKQTFNEFGFNQTNKTYLLDYFDTVNVYDITTQLPDFLEPVDIRLGVGDNLQAFTRKTPREITVAIDTFGNDQSLLENAFAVEQADGNRTIIINHQPKYGATEVNNADSLSGWSLAAAPSHEGTNIRLDTVNFVEGNGSIEFDITTGNPFANDAIIDLTFSPFDMSQFVGVGSFLFYVYLPDFVNFSSISLTWGSLSGHATVDTAADYYTASVTTDIDGNAWALGWQRLRFDWINSTATGSPDPTAIQFMKFVFSYTSSQTSFTGYHIDDVKLVRPEILTLHYQSWDVGTNSSGTAITTFGATSDIPFYSGQYDFFDPMIAHRAAAMLFRQIRLFDDANNEEALADREMKRLQKKFPSQMLKQTKSFGVKGLNFRRRKRSSTGSIGFF